ncbi:MFS transporter [Psychromonas sp. KJ10-10]|uniref:MFS transporter n=1 Tax=Psychromonas sp. KJ10-10 TaxID=3391823 RepID=UPI0039B5FCCF
MTRQPVQLSFLLIILLGAISALTPLAINMYLPAMPSIAKEFALSAGDIQITLTAYTGGFAIGQLLHGPLADSYGRKPILLIGTLCFTLASILSALAPSIEMLTWMRIAQGLSGAMLQLSFKPLCVTYLKKKSSQEPCHLSYW